MLPILAQKNANPPPPDEFLIVLIVICAIVLLVWLVIKVLFLLTLHKALARCQPHNRTMEPGTVWFNMIPLVELVWMFFTVNRIGESLHNEFRARGWDRGEDYGKGLGLATCILYIFGSLCGSIMSIAWLVCFIIYWVKIAGYSGQLANYPYEEYDAYDDDWGDRDDRDDRPRRGRSRDRDEDRDRDDRDEDRPWDRGRR